MKLPTAAEVLDTGCTWYGSMPVPWVAMWSDEKPGPIMDVTPTGIVPVGRRNHAALEDGTWFMSGPTVRTGTPDFGSTNSHRQRDCMRFGLCQICGKSCKNGPIWTIPNDEGMLEAWADLGVTINPPACGRCLVAAALYCPHLIAGGVPMYFAAAAEISGVDGDMFLPDGTRERGILPYTHPNRAFMLGRQLVMRPVDPIPLEWDHLRALYPMERE